MSPAKENSEHSVWDNLKGHWRLVHGGMLEEGFSLEFHDFFLKETLGWSVSFHRHSVEICINLHGRASFHDGGKSILMADNQVAVYTVPDKRPVAERIPGGHHCFYTLEFSCEWLENHLKKTREHLKPEILEFLNNPEKAPAFVECVQMPPPMIPLRMDLLAPPVSDAARGAWYYGKVFEILALTIFQQKEALIPSHKRNRERVARARALLESDLENPPSLEEMAETVGCSPFHLSRAFKSELNVSIPYYLRACRMEKAAEYLRKGMSVTDAAIAVGYNNLSAFIKAFGNYHCTTPSRWAAMWSKK